MKLLKTKCFILQTNESIESIARKLNSAQYSDENGRGIVSGMLKHDFFEATFTEKVKIIEQISYPGGDVESQERVKFVYIKFKIIRMDSERFLLYLINPPVSVKAFIEYLRLQFNRLYIEKYRFNLSTFHNCLVRSKEVKNIKIRSLKASSVKFSQRSAAKLELYSEYDALVELKKVYGEEDYVINKLLFSFDYFGKEQEITASSTGAISYGKSFDENLIIKSFSNSIEL